MRRTTLSSLNSSQLNARGDGPRAGGGEPRKPAPGWAAPSAFAGGLGAPMGGAARASLARRTSVFGGGSVGARLAQDPRPLGDKAYVAAATASVIGYLATHGYDRPLSPKLLATNKEFAAALAFLAARVDPAAPPLLPPPSGVAAGGAAGSSSAAARPFEEEAPLLFRRLGYPFPVTRSALQAVGSAHAWPPLVAALDWLVSLLAYDEKAAALAAAASAGADDDAGGDGDGGDDGGGDGDGGAFFALAASTYAAFLAGDDAGCEALKFRAVEAATARAARLDAAAAALSERLGGVAARCAAAAEGAAEAEALGRACADAAAEAGAEQAAAAAAAAEEGAHRAAAAAAATAARSSEDRLCAQRAGNAELARTVAGQGVTPADVARMEAASRGAADARRAADEAAAAADAAAAASAAPAAAAAAAAGAALSELRAALLALKCLPAASGKRAAGGAFALPCDRGLLPPGAGGPAAATEPQLAAAADSLRCHARPAVEGLREAQRGAAARLGAERLALEPSLEAALERAAASADRVRGLERAAAAAQAELDGARRAAEEAAEGARAAAAAEEAAAAAAWAQADACARAEEEGAAAARAAAAEGRAVRGLEAKRVADALFDAVAAALAHKQAVEEALAGAGARLVDVAATLGIGPEEEEEVGGEDGGGAGEEGEGGGDGEGGGGGGVDATADGSEWGRGD